MSRFERWSRRKLGEEVADEPDREPVALSPEPSEDEITGDAQQEPAVEPEASAPGSLDHTLPDPDDLPAGADFSAYLKQGVSRQLRRRALRRLWASGNYGVRDGLDDYDEDYREVLKPLGRDVAEQLRRWTRPAPEETELAARDDRQGGTTDADRSAPHPVEQDDSEETAVAEHGEADDARTLDQGSV
ncbi:DUF3306 domain-containing protein [Halomonas sp. SSL-5]|uniref:DUF3306 domain-containing protein n=1 Tax=Halomonas sp. SSL-5 TaxID=3065855 RepID=UPI0027399DB4|nr:DUF3306 domain-containing protein [Halomonas sp. SSL-5]MDY7117580.1 DUF3306 domain-containing protein [Halomonas sp. SSL-5]